MYISVAQATQKLNNEKYLEPDKKKNIFILQVQDYANITVWIFVNCSNPEATVKHHELDLFPNNCPFVNGIQQLPAESSHKGP